MPARKNPKSPPPPAPSVLPAAPADPNGDIVPLATLKPHPKNPRLGDTKAISASILAHGFYGCLGVQRSTNYILYGNHCAKALRRLGHETVRVYWIDCDAAKAEEIVLADNRTADLGQYDKPKLAALLGQVLDQAGSLAGTGYSREEYRRLCQQIAAAADEKTNGDPGTPAQEAPTRATKWELLLQIESETAQRDLLAELARRKLPARALTI